MCVQLEVAWALADAASTRPQATLLIEVAGAAVLPVLYEWLCVGSSEIHVQVLTALTNLALQEASAIASSKACPRAPLRICPCALEDLPMCP